MLQIERLELFEEKLGIKFDKLFAEFSPSYTLVCGAGKYKSIIINGEVHPHNGLEIEQNIRLIISAHDRSGRVLNSESVDVEASKFWGFDTFMVDMYIYSSPELVTKIRIYPTLGEE